jgi:hypothetical protein
MFFLDLDKASSAIPEIMKRQKTAQAMRCGMTEPKKRPAPNPMKDSKRVSGIWRFLFPRTLIFSRDMAVAG